MREFGDEIHSYALPFLDRNFWLFKHTRWSLVFSLDLGTSEAFCNEKSNVFLHTRPPIRITEIMVHLVSSRMNRITRLMSLVHEKSTKIITVRNPQSIKEREKTIRFGFKLSFSTTRHFIVHVTLGD